MGFLDFFKPKTDILPFEHIDGIPFVNKGEIIALNFLETDLKITKGKNEDLLNIPFQKIKNAEVLIEMAEKNKSVIGRAVVGGLLLGPVGAVVGGISGTGTNKKKNHFLNITYIENNEVKNLYLKGAFNSENICNIAQKQIAEKVKG